MQNLNKKGLSEIVQTTLIILLSISAMFTLWSYVKDLAGGLEETLSPAVNCLIQNSEAKGACINENGELEVTLTKEFGETITSIQFNLNGESFSCGDNSCQSCIFTEEESTKTIYLKPETEALDKDSLIVSINHCTPQKFIINQCA